MIYRSRIVIDPAKRAAKLKLNVGVSRVQLRGAKQARDRARDVAALELDRARAVMTFKPVRRYPNDLRILGHCFVELIGQLEAKTQQVAGFDAVVGELDRPPQHRNSFCIPGPSKVKPS